jgi:N-acetylneuraminic acid mutarotase
LTNGLQNGVLILFPHGLFCKIHFWKRRWLIFAFFKQNRSNMKLIYSSILFMFMCVQVQAQDWVQVASLPNAFNETHHSFGFAIDDTGYLVTGGSAAGAREDFYEYNATTDTWTELTPFPGGGRAFAIGDTWDGKAYFGFGTDGAQDYNDLWAFDPADMSWTELATCPCTPRTHPALIAHNGKVFVGMGGSSQGNLNDWWEYDIASDSWSQKANLPSPARHHPYQFGIGDFIYAGFGHGNNFISDEWFRYDPATDTWFQMADIPAEGRVAGTQFSYNGKGYALSGDGVDHRSMDTGEFWSFDPELNEWEALPVHPETSRWAPSSFIIDGEVYIVNGDTYLGNSQYEYVTEVYKFALEGNVNTNSFVEDETIFQAFPNPFNNALNLKWDVAINTENAVVRVYDVNNRMVLQNAKLTESLDLSAVAKGMLRVEVIDGENRYFQMVVKQ